MSAEISCDCGVGQLASPTPPSRGLVFSGDKRCVCTFRERGSKLPQNKAQASLRTTKVGYRISRQPFGLVQRLRGKAEVNRVNWLETFMQDLRYGARQLWLSPGFALVAVLSLALGIGANSAIFQLIDIVHLRTLPVQKPEELVAIDFAEGSMRSGWFSTRNPRFTYCQCEQAQ